MIFKEEQRLRWLIREAIKPRNLRPGRDYPQDDAPEVDAGDEIVATKELLQQAMKRLRTATLSQAGPYGRGAKERWIQHTMTIQGIINDLETASYQ